MAFYGVQVASGIIIDRLWKSDRTTIPWHDKAHWWSGRLLIVLALANIIYGIILIGNPLGFWIAFGLVLLIIIAAFALGNIYLKRSGAPQSSPETQQ